MKNDLESININEAKDSSLIINQKNDDKKSDEISYENKNINISSNKNIKGVSRFSLSSIKIEKEAKVKLNEEKSSAENFKDKFSSEELIEKWVKYIKIKQDKGQTIMGSLLEMTNLKLKEDGVISLETNSESNKLEIIKEIPALLSYLKESLNNYKIRLEINVISKNDSKLIFTNKEKLDYLKDLNPDIKLLINEFKIQL
ncbi:MAG: hypothetical protein P8K14_04220 [Flavobacteriaceae bacterium]|nr:hypothetical protein [Flavobacteriaceae bacterium]